MLNTKQKFKIAGALVVLLLLAFGVSCDWFVNATLNSINIVPSSVSLTTLNSTQQLTATGTYSDNSTKNLTSNPGTSWSSSDPTIASVSSTGLVKALVVTSTANDITITATNVSSSGAVSGTSTVCVGTTCTGSSSGTVTISPDTTSYSLTGVGGVGAALNFSATVDGSTVSATWSSSDTAVINFTNTSTGIAAFEGQGTTTITASTSSGTGTLTITVGP